jgi:hypothetical protein
VDIGRAFNYVFLDKDWVKKVLIGALLTLTIVGVPAVIGYTLRIMRTVVSGIDTPLPEWENIGTLWVEGIKTVPVYLFWFIPAILLGIFQTGDTSVTGSCLSWIVSTLCGVLASIAVLKVAVSGKMNDGFQFSDIVNRLTQNFGDYLIVFLMSYVLGIVAALGLIACGIGIFATAAYAGFVQSHLWAQAYRRSEGGGSLPTAPRF